MKACCFLTPCEAAGSRQPPFFVLRQVMASTANTGKRAFHRRFQAQINNELESATLPSSRLSGLNYIQQPL